MRAGAGNVVANTKTVAFGIVGPVSNEERRVERSHQTLARVTAPLALRTKRKP